MSTKVLTFLILPFISAAFADDFKTLNGKEYKDATVTRVEPDGIVVKTKSGVTKVYFAELPRDVQERLFALAAKVGRQMAFRRRAPPASTSTGTPNALSVCSNQGVSCVMTNTSGAPTLVTIS